MNKSGENKTAVAVTVLGLVPPIFRQRLLGEKNFRDKYSLYDNTIITFGSNALSLHSPEFFESVRSVLAGNGPSQLTDTDSREWTLSVDTSEGAAISLILSSDQQRLILPDFSTLSCDAATRCDFLEKTIEDVNLSSDAQQRWRTILAVRPLDDEEFDSFYNDIRLTPVHLARTIRSDIALGESSVTSLVPNSREYFERLIGAYDGSSTINEYARNEALRAFEHLSLWNPYEGFLFSLLLASHSALTKEIQVSHLDYDSLENAFSFLEEHGDILSQLGAFEVGLRIVSERPEVEPFLLRLVNRIRDDDPESTDSELRLFSALFVLVDGELSRKRILADRPVFYRRLASLAQAALIHRQLAQHEIDHEKLIAWAFDARGEQFFMQSLADMRTEPRWSPDLVAAAQFQSEFFGRIIIASNSLRENLGGGELFASTIGVGEQSINSRSDFPRPFFPGPLEGAEDSPGDLPEEFAKIIKKQLDSDEISPESFIALVNSAMTFRISSDYAELAARALSLCKYTLANLGEKSQLISILNGLAKVAAVSRSPALADEVRILVRRYQHDTEYTLNIEEAMHICLVASASRQKLSEWRGFAGEWLTELAFCRLEKGEGELLHSRLLALLHSEPALWTSCARADAALQAWSLK